MVYTPNPDDATNPTDAVLAETATAEFQALKTKINAMVGSYNSGAPVQAAVTLNPATIATTQPLGTNTAQVATMAAIFNALAGGSIATLPGFISGFKLSNDVGTPNTKIDVAIGVCVDSTNVTLINLVAPAVVNFTVVGAGGIDAGTMLSSNWWAILVIQGTSGTSVMATKEVAGASIAPVMPAGYTKYRYIGSIYQGASVISPFVQIGNSFYYKAAVLTLGAVHTSTFDAGLTPNPVYAPLSFKTKPIMAGFLLSSSVTSGSFMEFFNGQTTALSTTISAQAQVNNLSSYFNFDSLWTDTSANLQLLGGAEANCLVTLYTLGWVDPLVALYN